MKMLVTVFFLIQILSFASDHQLRNIDWEITKKEILKQGSKITNNKIVKIIRNIDGEKIGINYYFYKNKASQIVFIIPKRKENSLRELKRKFRIANVNKTKQRINLLLWDIKKELIYSSIISRLLKPIETNDWQTESTYISFRKNRNDIFIIFTHRKRHKEYKHLLDQAVQNKKKVYNNKLQQSFKTQGDFSAAWMKTFSAYETGQLLKDKTFIISLLNQCISRGNLYQARLLYDFKSHSIVLKTMEILKTTEGSFDHNVKYAIKKRHNFRNCFTIKKTTSNSITVRFLNSARNIKIFLKKNHLGLYKINVLKTFGGDILLTD